MLVCARVAPLLQLSESTSATGFSISSLGFRALVQTYKVVSDMGRPVGTQAFVVANGHYTEVHERLRKYCMRFKKE